MRYLVPVIGLALLPAASVCGGEATQRIVRDFRERGGRVTIDEKAEGKPIKVIDLTRLAVTEKDLTAISGMSTLEVLDLSHTPVNDDWPAQVQLMCVLPADGVDPTHVIVNTQGRVATHA
jgi:hypothetical protein